MKRKEERLICRLKIHWPCRGGRDGAGHRYYVCRFCGVFLVVTQ